MTQPSFKGGIFIDDETQARESGGLVLIDDHVVFTNDNRNVRFPVSAIEIELGGTANRIAYMRHMTQPKIILQTDDFSFFRQPGFKGSEAARKFRTKKRQHHSMFVATGLFLLFLTLGSFYLVFVEKDFVVGIIADRVPPKIEVALGDKVFDFQYGGLIPGGGLIEDADLNAKLYELSADLRAAVGEEDYKFKLHIVESDMVNAFAIPGGHIIIHSALIERSETAEELLGVLAHEMAHIKLRHSLKGLIHDMGMWLLISTITGGIEQLVPLLDQGTRFFMSQQFTRKHESEADEFGAKYLMDAGISPDGLASFFKHLKELEGDSGFMKNFAFLSTHPATEERIKFIEGLVVDDSQIFKTLDVEYESLKKILENK